LATTNSPSKRRNKKTPFLKKAQWTESPTTREEIELKSSHYQAALITTPKRQAGPLQRNFGGCRRVHVKARNLEELEILEMATFGGAFFLVLVIEIPHPARGLVWWLGK